ncbi:MAG TPA: S41 family peptidase [Armatimonadota bacterium]|nr:S41 family peptidase [Armatimonadota bacterium]
MRMRYQLVVALMVIALMISCFVAGSEFGVLRSAAPDGRAARIISGLLGLGTDGTAAAGVEDVSVRPLETFQEVLSHLRRQYVSPIEDESDLTYGAIRGMLSALRAEPYEDRYSRFLEPEEYRSFLEENEGHFGGIGAEIGLRETDLPAGVSDDLAGLSCPVCGADITNPKRFQVVIIAPLPDSPAIRAGVQAGDHVLRVDDSLTAGLSLGEVVGKIKGPPGTQVRLLVARAGEPQPLEIKVTRAVIQVRSVDYEMLPGKIGYARISTFNETTPELVAEALRELRADGMRGLLLDLRNNAGGGLDVCVRAASQFIGSGPVVYIQERGEPREPRKAGEVSSPFDLPLVVLTNVGTASAAEILAGAIQDAHLGTLVGMTTFGKGLVQTVIPLRDGSALALTTARYLTPDLRDIDRKGIEPDEQVEQPQSREYIPPMSEKDEQGAKALEILRTLIAQSAKVAA